MGTFISIRTSEDEVPLYRRRAIRVGLKWKSVDQSGVASEWDGGLGRGLALLMETGARAFTGVGRWLGGNVLEAQAPERWRVVSGISYGGISPCGR